MAKLKLSKSSLTQQRDQLKLYQKLLPSLDLKRRQLTVERDKAREAVLEARRRVDQLESRIGEELPMLAGGEFDLTGLVRLRERVVEEENVVGTRLPVLRRIECDVADYSWLTRPAWVDVLVLRLKEAAEERVRVEVGEQRVEVLNHAVRRITQRVNLFDRILIPEARKNIKRLKIYLGDLEREAVVRSKQAKAKGHSERVS